MRTGPVRNSPVSTASHRSIVLPIRVMRPSAPTATLVASSRSISGLSKRRSIARVSGAGGSAASAATIAGSNRWSDMRSRKSPASRSAAASTEWPLGRSQSGLRTARIGRPVDCARRPRKDFERVRPVAGGDQEFGRAALGRGADNPLDQRHAGYLGERLRFGQRAQPAALAGGDDQALHQDVRPAGRGRGLANFSLPILAD